MYVFIFSSGIFLISFSISFTIVAIFLNNKIDYSKITDKIIVNTSEFKLYENKYQLTDLLNLDNSYNNLDYDSMFFEDNTPVGKIIMKYNKNTDFFEYYCDRHISNRILEIVCRGYILNFKCKELYVNYNDEFNRRKLLLEKVKQEKEKKDKENRDKDKTNIFAKFKSYNYKKTENSTKTIDILIKTNYNKFKYLGKLHDYYNTKKVEDEYINISYDKFKSM
tara:strand:+ start:669 stop:1334 length:666 start_codon:yes stop_codon:yes gene_type:complete